MPTGCTTLYAGVSRVPGADTNAMGVRCTYPTSYNRAVDHVHFLSNYKTPKVQLHNPRRPNPRSWDAPARQLNEFGPAGYNYFSVAQTDEQRRWHSEQLAQSRRSPSLRAKEMKQEQGNLHQRGLQRVPAILLNFSPPPGTMAALTLPPRPATRS
uniref:Uncharacterized protein n=1 Tax=Haptolina brevifila TaxID=156173 RepID=A0A7S2GVV0_9EUKA|mmetsp:Transcript_48169/g.96069  ORF Transcript_48169/g.96069 Transcript_48169/m.96069 type:complete len:155 (+) Transcript_48169:31-495(+)